MNFTYSASGRVVMAGCVMWKFVLYYPIKYAPGSVVYLKYKAHRGKLEHVVVGHVRITNDIPLYLDVNHAMYNEEELIEYDDAIAIVQAYLDGFIQPSCT